MKWSSWYILPLLFLFVNQIAGVQHKAVIKITDAPNLSLQKKIEKNSNRLFTNLNKAQQKKCSPSMKNIKISKKAEASLSAIWEICPFYYDKSKSREYCLNRVGEEYQIRNIPIIMTSQSGEKSDKNECRQIVLIYDSKGYISNVSFAIDVVSYNSIMRKNLDEIMLKRRNLIIDYLEQLLTVYYRKDLRFLEEVYSEPLIPQSSNRLHLEKLKKAFQKSQQINATFENIKVVNHRGNQKIFGVTVILNWTSQSDKDKGYIFFLWDFENEAYPNIYIKSWQPYDITTPDEVICINDFKVV